MRFSDRSIVALATTSLGVVVAAQVGGKALRDALFLSTFPVADLPWMVMLGAALSLLGAVAMTSLLKTFGPRRVTSMLFVLSALLMGGLGLAFGSWPGLVTLALYIQMAVFGALLASGLWSTISESFDPSAARKNIGTVALGGTIGGVLGGLIAERVAAWSDPTAMFYVIVGAHLFCAFAIWFLKPLEELPASDEPPTLVESIGKLATEPYLTKLALLIVLATVLVNLFDYMMKEEAAAAFDQASLMQFFGAFYTVVGVLTFLVQLGLRRAVLERFGPGRAVSVLPVAAAAGTLGLLLLPTLTATVLARGALAVSQNSLFKSGYELFFAPLSADSKRNAKTLVDVGADRLGDMLGGLAIIVILFLIPEKTSAWMGVIAMLLVGALLWVIRGLRRGYVETLEAELVGRGGDLGITRTMIKSSNGRAFGVFVTQHSEHKPSLEDELKVWRERLAGPMDAELAQAAIELLELPDFADIAVAALKGRSTEYVDLLGAELTRSQAGFDTRSLIPQILATADPALTTSALVSGLSDRRFAVRYECGKALYGYERRGQRVDVNRAQILEIIETEVTVNRRIWNARQSVDETADSGDSVAQLLGERVDLSLQHVFHLLGLIHARKPLRVAFRGIHTDDRVLRGTALEYLQTILPLSIHQKLLAVLGEEIDNTLMVRSPQVALETLLASQATIGARLDAKKSVFDDLD